MAKKAGKVSNVTSTLEEHVEDVAVKNEEVNEAEESAKDASAKKAIFLNNYSEKLLKSREDAKGNEWVSVNLQVPYEVDGEKTKVWGSFLVKPGAIRDGERFTSTEDENGTKITKKVPNPGFKNVYIGPEDHPHNIKLNGIEGAPEIKMSAKEILGIVNANTNEFKKNRRLEAEAAKANAEVGVEAPEATSDELQM